MTKPRDRPKSGRPKRRPLGSSGLRSLPARENSLRESISSSSTARTVPRAETQFFGSTAFPAIISDDQNVVGRYLGQLSAQEFPSGADCPNYQEKYTEKQISEGTKVLNLLFEFPGFADSICRYLELSYTCMVPHPFIKACIESIQDTMQRSRGNRLRQLVVTLFANTAKPLDAFTTLPAEDYHTLFTGPNIRWEIIGFVLAILGVSLKYDVNKRSKPSETSRSDQKPDFIHRLAEGVDYCTAVCNNYSCVSPQALWLLYGNACLKNLVYGDMSFQLWRCMGDVSSMFFALGLHQEDSGLEATYPFYQVELRRRYAAQIYSMDKTISTFLGRPPRISGSYCANTMPADIDDEILLLEGDELDDALRNVDANGWNMDRQFRGATWRRIKLVISQFREEILGLCLGTRLSIGNEALARDILARQEAVWDQIPQELKYDEITGSQHIPPPQRYVVMTTYMDQKYTCFLLHRKLLNETEWTREPLYRISRSLLNTVLQVVSLSDQVSNMQRDISWPMLYYGLPGASILAVDLLKHLHPSFNTSNPEIMVIPRAEVIQNLAVFVSNLQRSINRREVNGESCKRAHGILSRILDEIIDPTNGQLTVLDMEVQQMPNSTPFPFTSGIDSDLNIDNFCSQIGNWDLALDTSAIVL
ncbi:fungal specific transcription factor domain-containing protein [Aspergillus neoniger CBS 115656]|uniref:C6 transcription factor n=1 Tax=Aspergillus neoniger (strain CBS 115656) TaxID=1448310 RepID=A0A318YND1_ASPNB|nr:C6 transcription factor [Aspergillus neoniger CBS 115656]PYH35839.1 C6 transcription factor [Aspergillus neoniger CBS 115656]